MTYVLGIDGGGTSTVAVIADQHGKIYAQYHTSASNPTAMKSPAFETIIYQCLRALQEQNPVVFHSVKSCFAGLAGVMEMGLEKSVYSIFKRFYGDEVSIIIENDACIALYAGTLGKPGIVQIAGTGAITYGLGVNQQTARTGGWGYLFDDEGSGYDVGVRALKAIVKSYDGRGPETILTTKVLKHCGVENVPELVHCVYSQEHPRTYIASLSRYVEESALQKDSIAREIIETSCAQFIEAIEACRKQTEWQKGMFIPVVLMGGVFTNFELYEELLSIIIAKKQLPYVFIAPKVSPVGGAVIGALQRIERTLAYTFLKQFSQELKTH